MQALNLGPSATPSPRPAPSPHHELIICNIELHFLRSADVWHLVHRRYWISICCYCHFSGENYRKNKNLIIWQLVHARAHTHTHTHTHTSCSLSTVKEWQVAFFLFSTVIAKYLICERGTPKWSPRWRSCLHIRKLHELWDGRIAVNLCL